MRVECRDDVVTRLHRIFLSAGIGSAKQVEAVRALGRAGGPEAARLIGQIYQDAFSGSAIQMACIAALGEAARTCPPVLPGTK
jgi:predicted trehalose synthase